MQEAAANFGISGAARANGIYSCLVNSKCVLSLHAAVPILELLETLNRSLQGSSVQVDGMIESVRLLKTELLNIRTLETFSEIFSKAHMMSDSLGLESVSLRRRKIRRRFEEGEAAGHRHQSAKEEYRFQFFAAIDVAMRHLNYYFDSPDLTEYQKLSNMLIPSTFDDNVTKNYPRLCNSSLELELKMYVRHYKRSTLA